MYVLHVVTISVLYSFFLDMSCRKKYHASSINHQVKSKSIHLFCTIRTALITLLTYLLTFIHYYTTTLYTRNYFLFTGYYFFYLNRWAVHLQKHKSHSQVLKWMFREKNSKPRFFKCQHFECSIQSLSTQSIHMPQYCSCVNRILIITRVVN